MASPLTDVIAPDTDPRITHHHATINSHTYHYLQALPPSGSYTHTTLLIHGWPDLSLAWRHQIPLLLSLGHRIIAPDMLGYGRSDAPDSLTSYGFKSVAADMAALVRDHLGEKGRIVLGGHDWGGAVVWRICLWDPELVGRVFVVCTPYAPPSTRPFVELRELVETRLPNFRYQLQLSSPEGPVQAAIKSEDQIRQFVRGMYGGRGPEGEILFSTARGLHVESVGKIGRSPLLTEAEEDYYVREFARHGVAPTLNWYKTTRVNWEDERGLEKSEIDVPALFVFATDDQALPEIMSRGMEAKIPQLQRRSVKAGHWALWQRPAEVNGHIEEFLKSTEAAAGTSHL